MNKKYFIFLYQCTVDVDKSMEKLYVAQKQTLI